MSDLLDNVVAAAGLTVFGAAPSAEPAPRLTLPGPELPGRIEALRGNLHARGLDHVVLLATGAPAAAARAIAATLGLRLTVLDDADPHRVSAALAHPDRTVVVLAAETADHLDDHLRVFPAPLVVVTAPGSPLEALGRSWGAELFLTDASPLSALSEYGLVAPGLAGADTAALLDEAAALLAPAPPPAAPAIAAGFSLAPFIRSAAETVGAPHAPDAPGAALGAAIAAAARSGRDKLAVAPDGTGIDGLGEWIDAVFAGVVPVALENPSSWGHEGPDVLSVTVGGALGRAIMPGGGIASDLSVNGPLGAQLLAWEQAARMLGAPAAESGVSLGGSDIPPETPALVEGSIEVYGETSASGLIGAIDALVRGVPEGGYVAIAAYLDRDGDAAAAAVRDALAGRVARAVTFGWGGRPARTGLGAVLQLTGAVTGDVPVPGGPYTFGGLQAARAAADRRAGRRFPTLRLHLTDRATGTDQLLAALGG
ncbi:glucose-6-phosphate isomerase [Dactylosporangium darangshiense]|uniref:Glucose-6-phosphate isomerase n=1 Tax=Dactylosporangium darangshiense TaxID=579108 RepID=A0ABP8D273_9ACTN